MGTSQVVDYFNNLINKFKTPARILPAILLRCTAMQRPGMSPQQIASKIIEDCKIAGIPTGENPDGSPNMVNQYSYIIAKNMCDALKQESVVQVSIPASSLIIQATGANAGGPVTCIGTNMTDSIAYGIMQ